MKRKRWSSPLAWALGLSLFLGLAISIGQAAPPERPGDATVRRVESADAAGIHLVPAANAHPVTAPGPGSPLADMNSERGTPAPQICRDWDLASDFRRYPNQENPNRDACGNPGVWHFMRADLDRRNYTPLSQFTTSAFNVFGLQQWHGTTYLAPAHYVPAVSINTTGTELLIGTIRIPANAVRAQSSDEMATVGWRSPVDGVVSVSGAISDIDSSEGYGIFWYIDRNTVNLASGSIPDGGAQDFHDGEGGLSLGQMPVSRGDMLYFSIYPGTVKLDLSIHLLTRAGQGARGQVVAYQELLRNNTGITDTFALALSPHAWDSALSAGLLGPLPDGGSATFTVFVTVPTDVFWYSTDVLTVTATSVTSPTASDTAVFVTRADAPPTISISPNALTSTQYVGEVATKTLTITNGNGVTLIYDIGNTPLTGAALLLHLDEPAGSTTFHDDSGFGQHASCVAPSCPTAGVGGVSGHAVSLNGSDSYLKVGSPVPAALQIQNEIALEAWIYASEYPNSDTLGTIVGCQLDGEASGYAIHLDGRVGADGQPSPDGHIHFQIGDGSFHTTNANAQVPLNQWVHVVAVRKANEDARIYYNGVQQPSTSVPWSGAIRYGNAELDIGRQSDYGNRYFKGMIDEVAIYDRALSADEVRAHYERGLGRGIAVPWLSVTPISGTVPSDSSQAVSFTFDASGVGPGAYTTTVTIQSSDPLTPIVAVPVTMIVSSEPGHGWVAGTVGDDQALGIEGVTITAGESITTTTDSSGRYSFYLPAGTYTLTASSHGFRFHPPRRVVTVPPDASGQDFRGLDRWKSYLSAIAWNYPPIPDAPTLNPISPQGYDSYGLTWSPATRAISYTLQEDADGSFAVPRTAYSGPSTAWQATGKAPGTYCYRVRGSNEYGGGYWSNVRCISVLQLRDDFSNPNSGWPAESDSISAVGYRSGEYRILVKQANWVVRAGPAISVGDFQCEVDAHNASHIRGAHGIYFGASDAGFYLFDVVYGYVRLLRYDRPNRTWSTSIMLQHSAIHQGSQTNHLKVIRRGEKITLYANGEQVAQTADSALGQGYVGLAAGAFAGNYDVHFDNFLLAYLDATTGSLRRDAGAALVEESAAPAWGVPLR